MKFKPRLHAFYGNASIISRTFVLLIYKLCELTDGEKEGKTEIQKFKYFEKEKSFLGEIKNFSKFLMGKW